jgi:hypothetical protein
MSVSSPSSPRLNSIDNLFSPLLLFSFIKEQNYGIKEGNVNLETGDFEMANVKAIKGSTANDCPSQVTVVFYPSTEY